MRWVVQGLALGLVSAAVTSGALVTKVRQFPRMPGSSVQGMAITDEGLLVQAYDGGQCRIFDLRAEGNAPVAGLPFASAGKDNHANAISLSDTRYEGGWLPLLYVTGGRPANGRMVCHVENIRKEGNVYRAERVQRITLCADFAWDMQPGSAYREADGFCRIWGAPTWMVDSRENCLYVFSAIYRTTRAYARFAKENRYVVTKLRLPAPTEGDVTLTRQDVLDQVLYDFDVLVTQSGVVRGGEIYYVFGFGRDQASRESSQLRIYNLRTREITGRIDLATAIPEELEGCDFYQGELHVVTQAGSLYKINPAAPTP